MHEFCQHIRNKSELSILPNIYNQKCKVKSQRDRSTLLIRFWNYFYSSFVILHHISSILRLFIDFKPPYWASYGQSPVTKPTAKKETIIIRDTRDSRIRDFGQWITSFSWQKVYEKNTCQSKFESFHQTLREAIEKYVPSKIVQAHNSDKPWINCKIKSWIKKRQKCLARYGKRSLHLNSGEIKFNTQLRRPSHYTTKQKLKSL